MIKDILLGIGVLLVLGILIRIFFIRKIISKDKSSNANWVDEFDIFD